MRAAVVGLALLLLAVPEVDAQATLRSSVDTTTVTVGDRITLTLAVDHETDATVVWPDSISLPPFEVVEARFLPAEVSGDAARSTALVTLVAFELGALEVPPLGVDVIGPDGSGTSLASDRFGVEVVTVGADESGDIREIRGPVAIPLGALRLALWISLPLLLAGLIYGLVRRFRPGGDEGARPAIGPPTRPPHELALEALDALAASGLPEQGRTKEFHIGVSEILRTYIERRFRVDALEMTTVEVLDGLSRAGVGDPFSSGLRRFLDQCDLVKFAKARPDPVASREVLDLGRKLVEESAPRVPPAEAA